MTGAGWHKIEQWGRTTNLLTLQQRGAAFKLAQRVRTGSRISDAEKNIGLRILDIVLTKEPELLWDTEEETKPAAPDDLPNFTPEIVKQMIVFDREHKRLEDYKFRFMKETLEKPLPGMTGR